MSDPQIYAALIALALTVIGALGSLITVLTERIKKGLNYNTALTEEARNAANGRLKDAIDRLAVERNRVVGLRELLREREDRIAFLEARLPQAEDLMSIYRDRRQSRSTEQEENDVLQRLMGNDE